MLLVPRQLLRSGMTGSVPYYGGRFTPAQAYAAAHPNRPAPPPAAPPPAAPSPPPPRAPRPAKAQAPVHPDTRAALRHLRDTGVLTDAEYDLLVLRSRG
jgi:hypothetical protein